MSDNEQEHVKLHSLQAMTLKEIYQYAKAYKVPYYSQMNKITKKAIEENIETVYIKPYDNKTVAKLASKIRYNK